MRARELDMRASPYDLHGYVSDRRYANITNDVNDVHIENSNNDGTCADTLREQKAGSQIDRREEKRVDFIRDPIFIETPEVMYTGIPLIRRLILQSNVLLCCIYYIYVA